MAKKKKAAAKKSRKGIGGRPTKYDPKFCDEIMTFFRQEPFQVERGHQGGRQEIPGKLPTFAGFATAIGVHKDTLVEWTKQHPEFSVAYQKAKQLQEDFLVQNALRGNYQPAFSIFFAKNNLGYVDRVNVVEEQAEGYDDLEGSENLADSPREARAKAAKGD